MRFFSNDSLFGRIFGTLGDIITVNLLFVLCSLPVVTLGAAWTAASHVLIRKRRMPDSAIIRPFFHAFRSNWRQSTIAWLGTLLLGFILITDIRIFAADGPWPCLPLYILFLLLTCAWALTTLFLFPVIACFDNTLKQLALQAFFFAAGKPHISLLLALTAALPVGLTLWSAAVFWSVLIVWVFMGFSVIAWLHSLLLARVFAPYLPEIETDDPQEDEPVAP